jgi:pyruvate/2-oxoglutarate dehydrogenase complex dihydrolipoamide acyltransferase (E2) component
VAATASTAPATLRGTTEKMSRLRKVIAKRMVESLQTSAQLTTVVEVDITSVSRLRDGAKGEFAQREGVKLSFMPFFAKATIDALKEHPKLNAAIDTDKGEVTYYDRENIAIAVDTEKGLLTPVIKDAGDLSIAGLARDFCVRWSAEDCADEGFSTFVLWDLSRPVDPASDADVRDALDRRGVRVLESAQILAESGAP